MFKSGGSQTRHPEFRRGALTLLPPPDRGPRNGEYRETAVRAAV